MLYLIDRPMTNEEHAKRSEKQTQEGGRAAEEIIGNHPILVVPSAVTDFILHSRGGHLVTESVLAHRGRDICRLARVHQIHPRPHHHLIVTMTNIDYQLPELPSQLLVLRSGETLTDSLTDNATIPGDREPTMMTEEVEVDVLMTVTDIIVPEMIDLVMTESGPEETRTGNGKGMIGEETVGVITAEMLNDIVTAIRTAPFLLALYLSQDRAPQHPDHPLRVDRLLWMKLFLPLRQVRHRQIRRLPLPLPTHLITKTRHCPMPMPLSPLR